MIRLDHQGGVSRQVTNPKQGRVGSQEAVEKLHPFNLWRGGRAGFVAFTLQITMDMPGCRASSFHPPRLQSERRHFFDKTPRMAQDPGICDICAKFRWQFCGERSGFEQSISEMSMIGQKHCPFCKTPALRGCEHLAIAAEARDFIRRCVDQCQGRAQWQSLCEARRARLRGSGDWSPEREDFTWLETAFCSEFLKRLAWFGGMDHEWRTRPDGEQGGFWVLLWSKEPKRLWWELRDEFERQHAACLRPQVPPASGSWLLTPN